MRQKPISDLSNEELLSAQKKAKNGTVFSGFGIGFLIGVAIYSTVINGLSFWTFFPLFFVLIFVNNVQKSKDIKQEVANRELK